MSRGERCAAAKDFEGALIVYDQGLEALPDDPWLLLHRARVLNRAGFSQESIETLQSAADLYPSSFVYPLFMGQILYDQGEYADALAALKDASRSDPDNDLIEAWTALAELGGGSFESGYLGLVRRVGACDTDCLSRLLLYCEDYLAEHWALARSIEQQMRDENRAGGLRSVGQRLAGAAERALTHTWHGAARLMVALRHPLNRGARQARLAFLHGALMYDLGRYETSAAAFYRALELEPESVLTRVYLAEVLSSRENYEAALQVLAGIEDERSEWRAILAELRGLALLRAGEHKQAQGHLATWVELRPLEWRALYNIGLCSLRLGRPQRARECFREALGQANPRIAQLRLAEMIRVSRVVSSS